MRWSTERSDRIGDWLGLSNRSCLAVKLQEGEKEMSKTERLPRICVGVDLHKLQFTVCAINEETGEVVLTGVFKTNSEGYKEFCENMHAAEAEQECSVELAVEATGNARYFKNKMEAEGFSVVVVNTSKFKVITTSTKKTDANDAATLAFYLSKDMLPQRNQILTVSEQKEKAGTVERSRGSRLLTIHCLVTQGDT